VFSLLFILIVCHCQVLTSYEPFRIKSLKLFWFIFLKHWRLHPIFFINTSYSNFRNFCAQKSFNCPLTSVKVSSSLETLRFAGRRSTFVKTGLACAHLRTIHFWSWLVHDWALACCGRARFVSTVHLDTFNVLLVLNFFLYVLVALQNFVVLDFAKLESLIHTSLKLFL